MSLFFKSAQTAAYALYGDFKLKAYANVGFHLDALTSFVCHLLRSLWNLICFAQRLLITPFYLINPLAWPSLPTHTFNLIDNALGFSVSIFTTAIYPAIFVLRTLTSVIRGYDENSNSDWGIDKEEQDLSLALAIL